MKKLLPYVLCFFAVMLAASCSEESEITTNADNGDQFRSRNASWRNSAWDGIIGIERGGEYFVTADENALKADLETVLLEQGMDTEIVHLSIVAQRVVNDPSETAYVLLGRDLNNRSIGVLLDRQSNGFVLLEPLLTVATSCSGCSSGCNLQYLLIDGKKVPYCNENGCVYDCTKSETGLM